ncbi:hypothetical protein [Nonomuraea sediminis]|uniref:hypothetical protein n=1 Tax=Nonomuraea sediminis TaxID=2835864 RepID=UPI001BDBEEC1|nr:hypothetical protein [Nonomuraea sediminis]
MSVHINLTDAELRPSIEFIDFLERWISKEPFDGTSWSERGRERVGTERRASRQDVRERTARLIDGDEGERYVARAYELFVALLIGDEATLNTVHARFRFIPVVGIPRSGGKYLTKQLLRAHGYDPKTVPEVLGHDGFPHAGPWRFGVSGNGWTRSLQAMAEYLTMVELFFACDQIATVPKKATKAVYAAGLFRTALGAPDEGLITVRHPVPSCVSTYETAGGLPPGGRFAVRGNIERSCESELMSLGFSRAELCRMDYFDAYLRYWENYQVRLAMGSAVIAREPRVLAFGAERYLARVTHPSIEEFHVRDRHPLRPDWMEKSEHALRRVAEQWERVGLEFPVTDVNAAL